MPSKLIKKSNIQYSTDCFLEKKMPQGQQRDKSNTSGKRVQAILDMPALGPIIITLQCGKPDSQELKP